jgi:hypothetical protein
LLNPQTKRWKLQTGADAFLRAPEQSHPGNDSIFPPTFQIHKICGALKNAISAERYDGKAPTALTPKSL